MIRQATCFDEAAIAALEAAIFSDSYSGALVAKSLACPHERSLVYTGKQGVLGYVLWQQTGEEAELLRIGVLPEARGRSIGRSLLEEMLCRLRAESVRSVYLEVRASNRTARNLYVSLGFEEIGCRRGYYENPKEDAILMKIEGFER